jgi:hypothetical protein
MENFCIGEELERIWNGSGYRKGIMESSCRHIYMPGRARVCRRGREDWRAGGV